MGSLQEGDKPQKHTHFPYRRSSDLFPGEEIEIGFVAFERRVRRGALGERHAVLREPPDRLPEFGNRGRAQRADRKSTRLNSSHVEISYAVFCLKKKTRI